MDSDGRVGYANSLALDTDGHPHISYYDWQAEDYTPRENLKYAAWDGTTWQIETVDSVGNVGSGTSLELDASGHPHIAYLDQTNWDLKYAEWTGTAWDIQTVDTGDTVPVGDWPSLRLDDAGHPHIAYAGEYWVYQVRYAVWNGTSWDIQVVTPEQGGGASLELDSLGHPHIGYYHQGQTRLASWNGTSWDVETADGGVQAFGPEGLALDAGDRPHLCYCKQVGENRGLYHALGQDPTCASFSAVQARAGIGGVTVEFDWTDPRPVVGFELVRRGPDGKALGMLPMAPAVMGQRRYHIADPEGRAGMTYEVQAVWADGTREAVGSVAVR